jgi:hypothetical protein
LTGATTNSIALLNNGSLTNLNRNGHTRAQARRAGTHPLCPRTELAILWALRNVSALFGLGQLTWLVARGHTTLCFSQDVSDLASFRIFNEDFTIDGAVHIAVTRAR